MWRDAYDDQETRCHQAPVAQCVPASTAVRNRLARPHLYGLPDLQPLEACEGQAGARRRQTSGGVKHKEGPGDDSWPSVLLSVRYPDVLHLSCLPQEFTPFALPA